MEMRSGGSSARMLTWSQILEMDHDNIVIGAHAVAHRDLKASDIEEVRNEIVKSKREMEARTGRIVEFFAPLLPILSLQRNGSQHLPDASEHLAFVSVLH
jgi:hypothetical protein